MKIMWNYMALKFYEHILCTLCYLETSLFSTMAEHQWRSILFLSSHGHTCQLFQFSQESQISPRLLVRAPNLPGNTYHGLFHFFFSLISLFWRYQKRKIKQEVDLALLFELFSIGKCITEHRHWLEINQSNWTIHGRKLERFSNAVIDIGNIQKAFGWFSENS